MTDLDELKYPVGRIERNKEPLDADARETLLRVLAETPATLRSLVEGLSDRELDTPYRPGGWTIRQVIHHVPDSHMNAYVRMKLAVTEQKPTIKTYEEALWAELPEARTAPIAMSLDLLDALHRRWTAFLRALPPADFGKAFQHTEWGLVSVDEALGMYAWHCRHHTAHVKLGLERARESK
jgi:hypothetical protein